MLLKMASDCFKKQAAAMYLKALKCQIILTYLTMSKIKIPTKYKPDWEKLLKLQPLEASVCKTEPISCNKL
jgi:hypothetical protein